MGTIYIGEVTDIKDQEEPCSEEGCQDNAVLEAQIENRYGTLPTYYRLKLCDDHAANRRIELE